MRGFIGKNKLHLHLFTIVCCHTLLGKQQKDSRRADQLRFPCVLHTFVAFVFFRSCCREVGRALEEGYKPLRTILIHRQVKNVTQKTNLKTFFMARHLRT